MPLYQYPQPQTGSGSWVRATSPTLVTPVLGVAAGTSLALGGATIGTNALAVTGTATISGLLTTNAGITAGGDVKAGAGNAFVFTGGPLLLNVGAGVNFRNSANNAFIPVRGKLTTDTAYTVGTVVQTGYLTIYDSTDTAYRVPCLV